MKRTDKSIEVFDYIKKRIEQGYAPTVREICAEFDFKSTSSAHRYIQILTNQGLLEKDDNKNRAIKLTGSNFISVPLVGTVTAGVPITAIQDITDYITFKPEKTYSNELFALKIRGDSMIKVGIIEGDIVIVEKSCVAKNGEICVVLCNESEATVKRFYKENGHFRLQPENDSMAPIIVDSCEVLGKVVGLIRYFK